MEFNGQNEQTKQKQIEQSDFERDGGLRFWEN